MLPFVLGFFSFQLVVEDHVYLGCARGPGFLDFFRVEQQLAVARRLARRQAARGYARTAKLGIGWLR